MHLLKTRLQTSQAWRQLATALAVACLMLLGVAAGAPAVAQESAEDDSGGDGLGGLLEGLDLQAPGESLESPRSPAEPGSPAEAEAPAAAAGPLFEAYRSMQAANALLAQGETGEATRAAQQRAVELLDQMIEAAQQPSESGGEGAPQSKSPQESPSSQSPQPAPGDARQSGDPEQRGDAEQRPGEENGEDSEGADSGEEGSAAGGPGQPAGQQAAAVPAAGEGARPGMRPEGAGAAVWGHLPERTRGMLRSEMPTEYLPGYATEISEYFRRLAEMKPDE